MKEIQQLEVPYSIPERVMYSGLLNFIVSQNAKLQLDKTKFLVEQIITVRNDGHGIAKDVKVWIMWAIGELPDKEGEWIAYDFNEEDLDIGAGIDAGSIGSGKITHIYFKELPFSGKSLADREIFYGFKLMVTCKDMFEKRKDKYSDIKKYYISKRQNEELKGKKVYYA